MKKRVTATVVVTWTTDIESEWYNGKEPVAEERRLLQGEHDYLLESIINNLNSGTATAEVTLEETPDMG